ncbi:SIR2 family protein [Mesorhizobium sp. M0166]|uniref:SIR2 family protein n=1 Tax=Mesorhizobium sp. M0166 TaxID=2956902 RepID=UPI0033370276
MTNSSAARVSMKTFSKLFAEATLKGHQSFAFFLGAGCSVSSGILPASTLALQWIRELKRRSTGTSLDFESWYAEKYPSFTTQNAGDFYALAMEELFPTLALRRMEVQRFISLKDPGFGYATLGSIMTSKTLGSLCNVVLTTNFDDLLQDALFLYHHAKPTVIAHEDMGGHAVPDPARPLIVKVHGDALDPRNLGTETDELPTSLASALGAILGGRGLVFFGYGGNDKSVITTLRRLPSEALTNGVFWVGKTLPRNPDMHDWLQERKCVWVQHQDFDEAMMNLDLEFGIAQPSPRRLSLLMSSYEHSREALSRRVGGTGTRGPEPAVDAKAEIAIDLARRLPEERRNEVLAEAIARLPRSARLAGFYAQHLRKMGRYDAARSQFEVALTLDPDNVPTLCHYASFIVDRAPLDKPGPLDEAEALLRRACRSNPYDPLALGTLASFLWTRRGLERREDADSFYQRALQADFSDAETLSSYANFLWRAYDRREEAIEYYERSIDINPSHFRTLANFGQLLYVSGDQGRAYRFVKTAVTRSSSAILRLEGLFYLLAHDQEAKRGGYLSTIHGLIHDGIRSPGWDLTPTVNHAAADGHKQILLLKALSEVISGSLSAESLNQFTEWQTVTDLTM